MRSTKTVTVEVDGRHPGTVIYSFIAPPEVLLDFASKLERLARAPLGARFEEPLGARGDPNARVAVAFAQCTPDHVPQLQAPSAYVRRRRVIEFVFHLGVLIFAIVGIVSVIHYLVGR
jgi:hypothetical protein